nr:MAG TPA: PcfK-like protein [Caudoviricetes sp.]
MFDRFGEFDSVEELNAAAEGQKEEGDMEALKALAVENGLDPEDAEDYMNGTWSQLANPRTAALGKLKVEAEHVKCAEIMGDWLDYIKDQCIEREEMQRAVRKKGKSLEGCIAEILKWSFAHQIPVDSHIASVAGVKANRVTIGIPGMATVKKIITKYYLGR